MRCLRAGNDRAVRSQHFRIALEFLGLFWAVPGLIFGLLLVHMCCLCVIANMNSMLVVCKLCYYMRI